MSKLQNLKPHHKKQHKAKAVGRGNGSGKGTYSSRGFKGQTARSGGTRRPGFEGGQTPLIRRLPKYRGFNNINRIEYQVVNVEQLNGMFNDGDNVNKASLYEKDLIQKKNKPVKILGDGELTKKLIVEADRFSKSAVAKIEKAEGSIKELLKKPAELVKKPA